MTQFIWNACRKCGQNTKHIVIGEKCVESSPDVYHCEEKYFIVECNGCETISFRKEVHDYEDYYEIDENEYTHSVEVEVFPHYIDGHIPIKSDSQLPRIVRDIYLESLRAIQEKAYTLAGLGLRATIEAICNDKNIGGKNLQIRINAMQRTGMISKSDADRLHAIRFLGNDAAHKIKRARKESVLIALKIVEHMLLSVYILEDEVNKHLEPPIASLDDAVPLLKKYLALVETSSLFTLTKWLGESKRRFEDNFNDIESSLVKLIEEGGFVWVELAVAPEDSPEKSAQWYKRTDAELKGVNDFDDFPF